MGNGQKRNRLEKAAENLVVSTLWNLVAKIEILWRISETSRKWWPRSVVRF